MVLLVGRRHGDVNDDDTTATLSITGEVDVANSPELREALYSLIDRGITNVIVDASGKEFIDSSASACWSAR